MGSAEVERFPSHLANDRHVSPATHRQVLSGLLFLYREVLDVDLPSMNEIERPAMRTRVPAVLRIDGARRRLAVGIHSGGIVQDWRRHENATC